MKKASLNFSQLLLALIFCFSAMAQSDNDSVKAFKEIYKSEAADRRLEREIKKKELLQAPSQITSANDTSASSKTKKEKCRRRKIDK